MTKQNHQSFHPILIIADHFDEIINRIDIKTETLLENQIFPQETRKNLNLIREKQIEKLKEAKEINLNRLSKDGFDEEAYSREWSHVLDDKSLSYRQQVDKIKEKLIRVDCVLLENQNLINGLDLWLTSWFYNEINLEFLM
jgi:LPS O-antigen subunit length determinant protein (WzzB/FepE family)